jgi:uncharacterized protein YdeI (BOF family)
MKKFLVLAIAILALSFSAFAQETEKMEVKPTDVDKTAEIPTKGYMKRGAPLGKSKKVSLAKVMKDPAKYSGKMVRVEGVIVRSCKMEGCWLELAPSKEAKAVRVKMKDHAFFVPLNSADAKAKAEGIFTVKTISKDEVEHMVKEGAKYNDINKDGTVTEISFEAYGVELTRAS